MMVLNRTTSFNLKRKQRQVIFLCLVLACMLSCFSHVLWIVALQAPLSMGFSRQEHWSGLPCPPLMLRYYGAIHNPTKVNDECHSRNIYGAMDGKETTPPAERVV